MPLGWKKFIFLFQLLSQFLYHQTKPGTQVVKLYLGLRVGKMKLFKKNKLSNTYNVHNNSLFLFRSALLQELERRRHNKSYHTHSNY